jgi:hypothetical protein
MSQNRLRLWEQHDAQRGSTPRALPATKLFQSKLPRPPNPSLNRTPRVRGFARAAGSRLASVR